MSGLSVSIAGNAAGAVRAMDEVGQKAASIAQKIKDGFTARIGQRLFDGLNSIIYGGACRAD